MKIKEPEMIYKSGKPTAVILPLADYKELLERVEDAADLEYLQKIRRQGATFRPLDDYLKEKKRRVSNRRRA
jgi:PHD/YefM family antitoxin component YafN of YafNO toxin-antitoxin module